MNECLVIVPAFNAAETIADVLAELKTLDLPVLVIDDGSLDTTAAVVRSHGWVRLLQHSFNQGKGQALKTGFAEADRLGYSHVLTIDADGQHPLLSVPEFLTTARRHPDSLIVGNRFADRSTIRNMPLLRRVSNAVSSGLISRLAGTVVADAQCGMRIYPLIPLRSLKLENNGYAMESEVLVKFARTGYPVIELPITCHYPAGTRTSRYRAFYDSWQIARAVWRAYQQVKRK